MKPPSATPVYQGALHPPWAAGPTKKVPAGGSVKLRALRTFVFLGLFVGGFFAAAGLVLVGEEGLLMGLMVMGLFLLLGGAVSFTLQRAPCPYCQGMLGGTFTSGLTLRDEKQQFECPHCFEWLVSDKAIVRALQDEDVVFAMVYSCPVFRNGGWPAECIACGAPAIRRMEAKTLQAGSLPLGTGAVADSAGAVKRVPYCEAHEAEVFAHQGDRGELLLLFKDYGARRRYLAANARRVPVKLARPKRAAS